jgi:HEAT repeat protein
MTDDARALLRDLEAERLAPDAALPLLTAAAHGLAAHEATTWELRVQACRGLGAIAGRAFGASWELAEKAAFVLLEVARETDAPVERAQLLSAMGRGFRNLWLMPYVHARLGDDDVRVVAAAIGAAGGLGFPALEEAVADFLDPQKAPALRLAAIAALGRMGAESAAARLAPLIDGADDACLAALAALTEIRSRAGETIAIAVLDRGPPPDVLAACVRYLAEMGHERVLRAVRTLSRDDDAAQRISASRASRAFHMERATDAAERILSALTETDRSARAALARRLRTLPVDSVLEQAALLLSDDPGGVVQIVSEVRAPEVTRMLLAIASDEGQQPDVRARAAGSIEANEPWEQAALIELVGSSKNTTVQVAAAKTIGAFAPLTFVLERLAFLSGHASPELRGALLWALQLAARPKDLVGPARARAEDLVRGLLGDPDLSVRRRAAYVAGNLDSRALVPDLVTLARASDEHADLRLAAFVGLSEIGSSERLQDLVFLVNREDDPAALGALSRAIERAASADEGTVARATVARATVVGATVARAKDRLPKLAAHVDARVRAAAARLAGCASDALPLEALLVLCSDASPRVRQAALGALARLATDETLRDVAEKPLMEALGDDDGVIRERAADALLTLAMPSSLRAVLDYVADTADEGAAARIASRLRLPPNPKPFAKDLTAILGRLDHEHAAYEALLELRVQALEALRPRDSIVPGPSVDQQIAMLFPTWTRLSTVRGFLPLAKSLRTAELLYTSANVAMADGDPSASIVLWAKSLEGYLHAWLAPRLAELQRQPDTLWELSSRASASWPTYQRWVQARWTDPVSVGAMSVDVPLRSTVNVLRDLSDRRVKPLDSPMSVTEWARLMMFLAVDHPSGPKNVLQVKAEADASVRLAHRLQVIALVRNSVTHRSVAATSTLDAFRTLYYAAFEDVTRMA